MNSGIGTPGAPGRTAPEVGQHTFEVLNEQRERWRGEVLAQDDYDPPLAGLTVLEFASITDRARDALLAGDHSEFARLVDANFNLRKSICDLARSHVEMIEAAWSVGASAKFAGSGGAIVGTVPPDEDGFARLTTALSGIGCTVFRPEV